MTPSPTQGAQAHTPGPWTVDDGNCIEAQIQRDGYASSPCLIARVLSGPVRVSHILMVGLEQDEIDANAALIAAAPEMAERIERLEREKAALQALATLSGEPPASNWATTEAHALIRAHIAHWAGRASTHPGEVNSLAVRIATALEATYSSAPSLASKVERLTEALAALLHFDEHGIDSPTAPGQYEVRSKARAALALVKEPARE